MFWGEKCNVQIDYASTALLTANLRLLRNVAPLLTNLKKIICTKLIFLNLVYYLL